MAKKKTLRSILFLCVGIALFWWVFRDTDIENLHKEFRKVNWRWIILSLAVNLLSLAIRAFRWRILLTPIHYTPCISKLFLANVGMAFPNQAILRGGEIARLGVVNKKGHLPAAFCCCL